jgi:ubiquinone/menaquinone biosynthesis C-methylase UbiE
VSNYTVVAHRDLAIMNPVSSDTLDAAIGQLDLSANARVIDIGCGKGELLRRIAATYACSVEGIDSSEALIAEAQQRVPRGTFRAADARMLPLAAESYDLAACIGASHAFLDDPLASLARLVRPEGLVLFGEGYWRTKPDAAYLAATGMTASEFGPLEATIGSAWNAGLALRESFVASEVDFVRYETTHARAIAAHARANPDDAEALAMLERSRKWQDAFERWGRHTMGFALYLFAKRD